MAIKNGSYKDYINRRTTSIADKEFIFILARPNDGGSMTLPNGQPQLYPKSHRFSLGQEQVRFGGKQRAIDYIQGVKSIFVDEQTEDERKLRKNIVIEFKYGSVKVYGYDTELLDRLMLSNFNGSNPDRNTQLVRTPEFILLDMEKNITEAIESEDFLYDAIHFCRKGDWFLVEAYAATLNIPVEEYKPEEVRFILKGKAQLNPKKFLEDLKNPKMAVKYEVQKAIKEGILVHNKQQNSISWAMNAENPLSISGMGKNAIDEFVHKLSTDEGKEVYVEIQAQLNPDKPKIKEVTNMKVMTDDQKLEAKKSQGLFAPEETDEELMAIIDRLVDREVIKFTRPMWFGYKDQKFKGKDKLLHEVKNSEVAYKAIIEDYRATK